MDKRITLLFSLIIFFTLKINAQTPGGVSATNLQLWLKTNSTGTKLNLNAISNQQADIVTWKADNDSSILFDPGGFNSPSYYYYNPSYHIGTYPAACFNTDLNGYKYMQTTSDVFKAGSFNEISIFSVQTINSLASNKNNPVFQTKITPPSTSKISIYMPDKNGNLTFKFGQNSDTLSVPKGNTLENKPYLWSFNLNPNNSGLNSIQRNGIVFGNTQFHSSPLTLTSPLRAYFGGGYPDTNNFNLAEFLVFQGTISSDERNRIESYLAIKYGLSLDQSTPRNYISSNSSTLMWDANTANGYGNNIAGMGIDNASGLIQKQNQSINTENNGNMIAMSWGNFMPSNILNNYNVGTDKDRIFYTWSDNGANVSLPNNLDLPKGIIDSFCATRISREWMVQRTLADTNANTSRAMQVRIDLNNTFNLTNKTTASFQLLIDNDGNGNFSNGTYRRISADSFVNNVAIFNNVNWDIDKNGVDVFTLLIDADNIKPIASVSDTFYAVKGDSVNISNLIYNVNTTKYDYKIYNSSNQLVDSNLSIPYYLKSNGVYDVVPTNKATGCGGFRTSIHIIFREILKVWKEVSDANKNKNAEPNEQLTYKIYVVNVDSIAHTAINHVTISDPIPQYTSYVSGSGGTLSGNNVIFDYTPINLLPGDTLKLIPTFSVLAPAIMNGIDKISNMALVSASYLNPNTPSVPTTLTIIKNAGCDTSNLSSIRLPGDSTVIYSGNYFADAFLTKTLQNPDSSYINNNADFKIVASNKGPQSANSLIIRDTLASNLGDPTNIQLSAGTYTYNATSRVLVWSLSKILINTNETLTFSSKILSGNTLQNYAYLSSGTPDSIKGNNVSYVTSGIKVRDNLFTTGVHNNVITPNGDGLNDYFVITGLTDYPNNELTIFNRWGNAIYHTTNYQNNWDANGLADGTYYYVLTANKGTEKASFKGWIEVIRSKSE